MFQFELFSTDYNSRYITLEEEEDFDDDDDDIDFDSYEYELSGLERSNRTPSSINNTNLLKKEKPKIFVVYVNEKKYYFDQNLLMMASDVISKFCQENPGCQKYHFDFNDECNIMKKIENLFQFKFETFLISEKMAMENIIGAFRFNCFDILTNNMNGPISFPMKLQMPAWIYKEIKNNSLQQLKIQTLKKVYKCKTYEILSSTTIKAFFNENPEVDTFCYEFKDDNHEFQLISDYLNLGTIMINPSNMNLVYDIATELQISSLLKKVEKFVNKLEAQRKIIEENFSIVEPVEQLFDLLKNINSMEIIEITHQILLSIWPYSKDNIREMVSCFSVFIEHNMPIHKKILQLCIALDNEKRESNYLHLFIPFLSDNLLHSFYSDFAFLYLLMNHGFVSVQSIKLHFESCFPRTWQYIHWVLPELLESYVPTWKSNLGNDDNSLFITFIKQLYKEGKEDNFDKFKQMRNSGDVPDPIFEVIKNDKIDTLQLIFSQSKESLNSEVPFNLFEKNQKLTLINYAAFYGSVKCFNFLFLNHADISQKTLAYAISNGNIEIIRTIYQHLE